MRAFHAIGAAALLIAWAIPVSSHADGPPGASTAVWAPAPGCRCPPRHVWRPHRLVRGYAWHRRHWRPVPIAVARWPAYNPPLPSPYDSAYDRVHTQYMRAREFGGEFLIEPDYVPRPPLPGLPRFLTAAGGGVFEYDIIAGGYVQLAQRDVPRALPVAVPYPLPPR